MPVLSDLASPIKFVGIGKLETGFKIHTDLMDAGFFTNVSTFPVVPLNQTGIRFLVTRHITKDHIKQFVDTLQSLFYKALREESTKVEFVRKEFQLPIAS